MRYPVLIRAGGLIHIKLRIIDESPITTDIPNPIPADIQTDLGAVLREVYDEGARRWTGHEPHAPSYPAFTYGPGNFHTLKES